MNYQSALRYLYSFLNYEQLSFRYRRDLNLERMSRLLDWFGHPENCFRSILIGGTNGKGSTAAFLTSLLIASGKKTGLYTSPHLVDVRERIRVNGQVIPKADFWELVRKIRRTIGNRKSEIAESGPITFFEITTLLAILYFQKRKVEYAVFEAGMGGRLDATNVLSPVLTVLTPVGHDHMQYLGRAIAGIAREKAALIKPGAPVVSGPQPLEAERVFRNAAKKKQAKIFFYGSSFRAARPLVHREGCRFDFEMEQFRLRRVEIQLRGAFQVRNAALALAAYRVLLSANGDVLREPQIRRALREAFWPGRFEVVRGKSGRFVILDGAHNEEAMKEFVRSLKALFPREEKIAILGCSRDKDIPNVLRPLGKVVSRFVVTQANHPRAAEPKTIIEILNEMNIQRPCHWAPTVREAVSLSSRLARFADASAKRTARRSAIVITGSLFLVGEARKILKCRNFI